MSSTQLISGVSGDSEERIRDLFDLAVVTKLSLDLFAVAGLIYA